MKKVGVVLNEARLKHQIKLEDVANATKIRIEYLQAIEENNFTSLPPAIFVKGFLQHYARYLRLDEQTVLALFRRDFKVGAKGKIIPREFLKPISRRRNIFTPHLTTVISVGTVLLCVLGYVGFQWYRLQQPPRLEVYTPKENETVSQSVVVSGKTQSDAVVYVNGTPISLDTEGVFQTDVTLTANGEQTITIRAEDRKNRGTEIQRKVKVQ